MSASLIHFLDKAILEEEVYTSNDTSVVPVGCYKAIVEGFGGGGAGGQAGTLFTSGAIGGSGSIRLTKLVDVIPGETLTITVGIGGASSGANGTASIINSTTNGDIAKFSGGLGGAVGQNDDNRKVGLPDLHIGGLGGNGDISGAPTARPGEQGSDSVDGYSGGAGGAVVGQSGGGGGGGAGPEGDGGAAGSGGAGTAAAGSNTGAGGGGGASGNHAGGAGTDGKVTIYYINPN